MDNIEIETNGDVLREQMIKDIQLQFKKKMSREVCDNARIDMKSNSLEFSVGGCGGQRRNGSRFCQDCSDNYNKQYGN